MMTLQQKVQRLDKQQMLSSLDAFPDQIAQAWDESSRIAVPASYRAVKKIVVAGMGGSAFPARIAADFLRPSSKATFEVIEQYDIPAYVGPDTLVIASSYSGGTEESVSALRQARQRGAKLMVISSGGTLAKLATQWKIPAYIFDARYNPSQQPRMGTGYMLFGIMGLLAAAGQLRVSTPELHRAIEKARRAGKQWSVQAPQQRNTTLQLAKKLCTRIPLIVGSEHLENVALAYRNRFHENSKHFALHFPIPGLNHHLMEGLAHPKVALHVLMLRSKFLHARNEKRYGISKKVFQRQHFSVDDVKVSAQSRLEEIVLHLTFSGYLSFWLAMEHDIDPSPIPWVDYFKAQLK
ncbi:MAG: SIS domain-containing protein [Candidatus Nomurabacteria bacterium]|nr:MAG: SIS domain-containing protein [Candidatus Nomurabacteria bacterium]